MYKNIALGLTLFYYELYSRFAGEVFYDDWYMALFNVILTSLPVISLGVLEQDVSSEVCLQVNKLNENHTHTHEKAIILVLNGCLQEFLV